MTPNRAEQQAIAAAFGQNVEAWRKKRGLSERQLAERAELGRGHIRLIERGERTPELGTFLKLAGALDLDPDELLSGVKWQQPEE